jgi:NAD(P)-dependent dehydrogenase (short-subunit alcohol dehydrogenase family)
MATTRRSGRKPSTAKKASAKKPAKTSTAGKAAPKQSPARKSTSARDTTTHATKKQTRKSGSAQGSKRPRSGELGRYEERGEKEAERQRRRQPAQEQRREARAKQQSDDGEAASQLGARRYPEPPLPKQHLEKPGNEHELEPRPSYQAPHYRGSGKLEGKVALITGADSGIGRAVAVLYAREGADVAIAYLSEHEDAEETKRAVEAEGRRAILIPGDVSEPSYARAAVKATVDQLGSLDVLVNNAAYQQHQKSLLDVTDEQLERTFRTNIFGYFYMARAALEHLQEGGVIVNSGSVTGIEGSGELLDYASTKGAIHAFTKSLAQNLLDRGIRVNCVAPGPVWTPLNPADVDAEEASKFGADVPMKRPAQPEELAPAYVFLASPVDSSYITGEVLPVLGGNTVNCSDSAASPVPRLSCPRPAGPQFQAGRDRIATRLPLAPSAT